MKKLIFPLLLMLAIGMLAAVESEASNVVGYVKYHCEGGLLSAIALPMEQGYASSEEVGDDYEATSIGFWDPADGGWYMVDKNPWGVGWTEDFEVANGDVLLMYGDDTVDFFSIGDLPAVLPNYSLLGGYLNTLMVPLDRSDFSSSEDIGDELEGTSIGYWDPADGGWYMVDKNPWGVGWTEDFEISIGDAVLVYLDEDLTWPSAGMKRVK